MKICLVPGHGPVRDKGAENRDGTTELDWNRDLVCRIARHLQGKASVTIVHRSQEKLSPVHMINTTNADWAFEFHLNDSADNTASGTEMYHFITSSKGKLGAQAMLDAAVGVLGLRNRGIKTAKDNNGRGLHFLSGTRMPAVLLESFFIDNSSDLAVGNEKKEDLAKAYADAMLLLPV